MSPNLPEKIQLGLEELAVIRGMMSPLIARAGEPELPVIETAAACTMLHSFYTEIEKILKLIALDLDKKIPSSESLASRFAKPDGGGHRGSTGGYHNRPRNAPSSPRCK